MIHSRYVTIVTDFTWNVLHKFRLKTCQGPLSVAAMIFHTWIYIIDQADFYYGNESCVYIPFEKLQRARRSIAG